MEDEQRIVELVLNLRVPRLREEALIELSRIKEVFHNMAIYLWYSVGTIAILVQEIVAIYPSLSPPTLNQQSSQQVCNVLGLLQCLALHPQTKTPFLTGKRPKNDQITLSLLQCTPASSALSALPGLVSGLVSSIVSGLISGLISLVEAQQWSLEPVFCGHALSEWRSFHWECVQFFAADL